MNLPKLFLITALLGFSSTVFATDVKVANFGGTFSRTPTGAISLTVPDNLPVSFLVEITPVLGIGGTLTLTLPNPDTHNVGLGGVITDTWTSAAVGTFNFTTTAGLTFTGVFNCAAAACIYTQNASGTVESFNGAFSGTLNGTEQIAGLTTQGFKGGQALQGTTTAATAVPEAGTLGMVGMGLLGIAGFAKRKFSAAAASKLVAL